jgi:trans-aconitate 2-methyltransferase
MGRDVLDRLELRGDETVLDAGCGTGRVTELLLERLPRGRVIALDASEAMLADARGRLERFGDRVTFVASDLGRPLPIREPVDAILSTATAHWVPDQDALWSGLAAVARSGAQLVSQSGGEGNCEDVFDAMEAEGEDPRARLRFSSVRVARDRLRAAGFEVIAAWLARAPVRFEKRARLEDYLATVFLGPLTDRPAEALPELARAIATRMRAPALDYVRLNVVARRT